MRSQSDDRLLAPTSIASGDLTEVEEDRAEVDVCARELERVVGAEQSIACAEVSDRGLVGAGVRHRRRRRDQRRRARRRGIDERLGERDRPVREPRSTRSGLPATISYRAACARTYACSCVGLDPAASSSARATHPPPRRRRRGASGRCERSIAVTAASTSRSVGHEPVERDAAAPRRPTFSREAQRLAERAERAGVETVRQPFGRAAQAPGPPPGTRRSRTPASPASRSASAALGSRSDTSSPRSGRARSPRGSGARAARRDPRAGRRAATRSSARHGRAGRRGPGAEAARRRRRGRACGRTRARSRRARPTGARAGGTPCARGRGAARRPSRSSCCRDGAQPVGPDDAAHHRCVAEQLLLGGRQEVDPGGDDAEHAVRQATHVAAGRLHADELLGVERVAGRSLDDGRPEVLVGRIASEERLDEASRLGLGRAGRARRSARSACPRPSPAAARAARAARRRRRGAERPRRGRRARRRSRGARRRPSAGRRSRGRADGARRATRGRCASRRRAPRRRSLRPTSSGTSPTSGSRLETTQARSAARHEIVDGGTRASPPSRAASSFSWIPACAFTISPSAQNETPSPYGRQRP